MTPQQLVFGAAQAVREVVVAASRLGNLFLFPDAWPKGGTSTEDLALVGIAFQQRTRKLRLLTAVPHHRHFLLLFLSALDSCKRRATSSCPS